MIWQLRWRCQGRAVLPQFLLHAAEREDRNELLDPRLKLVSGLLVFVELRYLIERNP